MKILFSTIIPLSVMSRFCAAFLSSSSSTFVRTPFLRTCSLGTATRSYSKTALNMKLQTAIVGLPNVGKSTLFNALTETQGAEAANYPFCTIEPNVGIVEVPDPKLSVLEKINSSEKVGFPPYTIICQPRSLSFQRVFILH
mmetsp:Transcript_4309/g.12026  ORF Transcript_4309/g.12026 Transcript_4309/m.12026 type:complete len:141 (+) Transcript_4309:250-672(+)